MSRGVRGDTSGVPFLVWASPPRPRSPTWWARPTSSTSTWECKLLLFIFVKPFLNINLGLGEAAVQLSFTPLNIALLAQLMVQFRVHVTTLFYLSTGTCLTNPTKTPFTLWSISCWINWTPLASVRRTGQYLH